MLTVDTEGCFTHPYVERSTCGILTFLGIFLSLSLYVVWLRLAYCILIESLS